VMRHELAHCHGLVHPAGQAADQWVRADEPVATRKPASPPTTTPPKRHEATNTAAPPASHRRVVHERTSQSLRWVIESISKEYFDSISRSQLRDLDNGGRPRLGCKRVVAESSIQTVGEGTRVLRVFDKDPPVAKAPRDDSSKPNRPRRSPVRFKEREVARALRGARRAGEVVDRVEIDPVSGKIVVVLAKQGEVVAQNELDTWKEKHAGQASRD